MNIVVIGSGNVASHLARALYMAKHRILQVCSRTIDNAQILANEVNADSIDEVQQINVQADLYILSIKDDALAEVVEQLPDVDGMVVHTAGSVSVNILSRFKNYGVFYPFQTFVKSAELQFDAIPILVEANTIANASLLMGLGNELSKRVLQASSDQRGALHISAVFACNFVNHMYRLGEDVLKESGLPFELLHPLIQETANKVLRMSPSVAQTGPAARNDQQIIQKHLNQLEGQKETQQIYRMLTDSILKYNK
ncbi:DUF2520 domain-containing protein [Carboxylicivirga sediminis]|uniref:DUF2520 domain-containing protein n=1 Tax=Carboxylicivirga sediminis TaxID=2006564 RepID=A0A941F5H8_9BACT|nr:DUF2520 domain-containing protein [Carboxylicivirga sediminis]MBR8536314.1 DUF2520 domain-containing protein [Carboxylicivirga sediminis]